MPQRVRAYVALGGNLGDAGAALRQAIKALNELPQTRLERASSFYKTAALNTDSGHAAPAAGPDYVNAVDVLGHQADGRWLSGLVWLSASQTIGKTS